MVMFENAERFLNRNSDELIPLRKELDISLSPPEAYSLLREYDDTGYTYLLESAETETTAIKQVSDDKGELGGRGKYSQIGFEPSAVIEIGLEEASVENFGNLEIEFDNSVQNPSGGQIREDYDVLDVLRDICPNLDAPSMEENRPNFLGGLVGFHPYEMVYDIKPLDGVSDDFSSVFVLSDRYLEFDHNTGKAELVFTPIGNNSTEKLGSIEEEARQISEFLSSTSPNLLDEISLIDESSGNREDFEDGVRNIKERVLEGEIYQGVISRKREIKMEADPLSIYSGLREKNPSPYMYILEFDGQGVLGASPETLVSVHHEAGEDIVETNPIAGTRPRGRSPDEDRKLMGEMLADDKERAEHNMLVDLGRNDLRRVAKQGTVSVDDYMSVVQYKNVQHIESRASAELASDKDRFDAMRSVFPAGTLTGAPKIRAMEIIAEEENSSRGIYGGAIGYYSLNGDLNSAIAIRSMDFRELNNYLEGSIQAGAGIVQDSVPEEEFEETENKMKSLTQVLDELGGVEDE